MRGRLFSFLLHSNCICHLPHLTAKKHYLESLVYFLSNFQLIFWGFPAFLLESERILNYGLFMDQIWNCKAHKYFAWSSHSILSGHCKFYHSFAHMLAVWWYTYSALYLLILWSRFLVRLVHTHTSYCIGLYNRVKTRLLNFHDLQLQWIQASFLLLWTF